MLILQYNSNMGEPYVANYYSGMTFPYMSQGINDGGAWSSGGDPMAFLGYSGDQQQGAYMSEGMFGQSSFGYSQPAAGFNVFHGGDYSTWGNARPGARASQGYRDDYYADYSMTNGMDRNTAGIKQVEQGVSGLSLRENSSSKDLDRKADINKSNDFGSGGQQRSQPKKTTWASIASQPARSQPKMKSKSIPPAPMLPGKSLDIGTWDSKNSMSKPVGGMQSRQAWGGPRGRGGVPGAYSQMPTPQVIPGASLHQQQQQQHQAPPPIREQRISHPQPLAPQASHPPQRDDLHPVLDKLRAAQEYNPKDFDTNPKGARFFIIKSYSEDDIHRSIKYSIWCSTEHGNRRLDQAFKERQGKGPIYLLFSVNGSGHFCGVAQMMSEVDYETQSGVWAQSKWKGQFQVKWVYVKDVPNSQLRHIRLENNENKPVTNSRDTQEVPLEQGKQVLKIIAAYQHSTSIFDDFIHYEKRQEEESLKKV